MPDLLPSSNSGATPREDPPAELAGGGPSPYLSDDPWSADQAERLGRRGFAARIARTIAERRESAGIVVALYGAWGEGKTSVLEMVKHDLAASEHVVVVEFNPWRFRDADHLVSVFFETLAQRIRATLEQRTSVPTRRERFLDSLRGRRPMELRRRSDIIARALRDYSKLLKGVPVVGTVAEAAEAAGEIAGEPSLETLRERVEAGIRQAGLRPVIVIDDMDRLDGAEVRSIVRLVKLTARFENTTYLLAFDPTVVAASLAEVVGGQDESAGLRYLEKIIQVPLQLPAADQDTLFTLMLEFLNGAIGDVDAEFPESEQQAFVRYVQLLFLARPRTIRDAKRYANAVGFVLPLVQGEVNVGDLLLLEALRAWYPAVHSRLLEHRVLLVGDALGRPPVGLPGDGSSMGREAAAAAWAGLLEGLGGHEERAVREALEHLFPFVQAVTQNTFYGPEPGTRWDRRQQVASRNYFDRYFQYAIPKTDVGDRVVDEIQSHLTKSDVEAAVQALLQQTSQDAARRLVDKLSGRVQSLSGAAAAALIRTLAKVGELFSAHDSGLLGDWVSPAAGAARIIRHCLTRVPETDRVGLAIEVVTTTPSLRFATSCYQWLRALGTEREDGTAPLSDASEERIRSAVGARLSDEHQRKPLYRREPSSDRRALLAWWGICTSAEQTGGDLAARFAADPSEAVAFIMPFRSHGFMVETGLPTPDVVADNDYEEAGRLVEPAIVFAALERVYGERLGLYDPNDRPLFATPEEATANQFALKFRRAQSGERGGEPDDDE